jgi:type I restriction enzyme S subunit
MVLPESIPIALNKADCVQIRTNRLVANAEYLCWLLNSPRTLEMVSGMIQGQTRSRISMGRLAQIAVPVPPLSGQKEFSAQVVAIRGMQAAGEKSRSVIQNTATSLSQSMFE